MPADPAHQAAHANDDGFHPHSKLFAAPLADEAPVARQPAPAQHPAPEAAEPVLRQHAEPTRMPNVEDFPPVVQAELERRSAPAAHVPQEERGAMGLLKRITNSLGRRDEEADYEHAEPAPRAQARERQLSPEASVYAPRRSQRDESGRPAASARQGHDDDQLEIPAFLRRQSN
jgi:cell division protein FtsZ